MAKSDLQNPAFANDNAAREALEAIRWPRWAVLPSLRQLRSREDRQGRGQRLPSRPVLLRRLQRPVHGHGRHGHGARQESRSLEHNQLKVTFNSSSQTFKIALIRDSAKLASIELNANEASIIAAVILDAA